MDIEYDEAKNQSNIAKHGLSFEEAARVFRDPDLWETVDTRKDYGEERRLCFGSVPENSICGRVYSVAYTLRGENIRIISARKANEREQYAYYRRFE